MKVGIMGGTFDPIHIGHLLLGEFAYEDFGLDEIWFVPNGNPPHKETKDSEQALRNRVEMVRHFGLQLAVHQRHGSFFEQVFSQYGVRLQIDQHVRQGVADADYAFHPIVLFVWVLRGAYMESIFTRFT